MAKKPDWKKIAYALAQRVTFSVNHLSAKGESSGGGLILNVKNGTTQHWREFMADGLEMMPGVTVDRELLHARTYSQRKRILNARDTHRQKSA